MNKLEQALEDHKKGNFESANEGYQEVLQEEPENTDVLYLLANLQIAWGKLDEALSTIGKAIKFNDEAPSYLQLKASILARMGKNEEALESVLKAISENPNLYQAHILAGHIFYLKGNKPDAEKHFNLAIKLDDKKAEGHINIAKLLMENGETQKAINILRNQEQLDENNVAIKLMLGQAFIENGAYNFAENYFNKVLAADQENELAGLFLGISKLYTGDMKNAEQLILAFNQSRENTREGLAAMGLLMFQKNRYLKAINYMTQAIGNGLCPDSWKKCLFESYAKFGKYEAAEKYYENKIKKNESDYVSINRLAELKELQGQHEEAIDYYKRVPLDHSKNMPAQLGLARTLLAMEKASEAEDILRNILMKTKNHAEATLLLINSLLLQDKKKDSLNLIESAETVNYNDVYKKTFRVIHGLILDKMKNYKQAEKVFDKNISVPVQKNKRLTTEEVKTASQFTSEIKTDFKPPVFILGTLSTGINQFVNWLHSQGVYVLNDRIVSMGRTDILHSYVDIQKLSEADDEMVNLERNIYFQKAKAIVPQLENDSIIADAMFINSQQIPVIKKIFPDAHVLLLTRKKEDIEFHQSVFGEEHVLASDWKETIKQIKQAGLNYTKVKTDKWLKGDKEILKNLSDILNKNLSEYKTEKTKYWRRSYFEKGHWKKYK